MTNHQQDQQRQQQTRLERVGVSVPTVISWVSAIIGVTAWLGWAALETRIGKLESGESTPMAAVTRQRFESADRIHARTEIQIDRLEDRLDNLDGRLRSIEARIHTGGQPPWRIGRNTTIAEIAQFFTPDILRLPKPVKPPLNRPQYEPTDRENR